MTLLSVPPSTEKVGKIKQLVSEFAPSAIPTKTSLQSNQAVSARIKEFSLDELQNLYDCPLSDKQKKALFSLEQKVAKIVDVNTIKALSRLTLEQFPSEEAYLAAKGALEQKLTDNQCAKLLKKLLDLKVEDFPSKKDFLGAQAQLEHEIEKIIEPVVKELEEELIKLGYETRPSIILGLKLLLSLAAMHYVPSIYGRVAANTVLAQILPKLVGPYAKYAQDFLNVSVETLAALGYLASNYAPDYVPTALSALSSYTPAALMSQFVASYGPATILVGPATILAYEAYKAADSQKIAEATETAGDFFDLMYGQADDKTYEKHSDNWATKDVGELASDITSSISAGMGWLWNKAKRASGFNTASNATPAVDTSISPTKLHLS